MNKRVLSVGCLVLAMMVLCAAIVGTAFFSIRRVITSGFSWNLGNNDRFSAQADEEKRVTAATPLTLDVESTNGDIDIEKGDSDEVIVKVQKTVWASSQVKAEEMLESLKLEVKQDGSRLYLRAELPQGDLGMKLVAYQVNFVIQTPEKTSVRAHSSFGRVTLSGTQGDADLSSSSGKVVAKDLQSEVLRLSSDFGEIQVDGSTASQLDAQTSSGDVLLEEMTVKGKITARTDFGSVKLVHAQANSYDLRSSSGAISVNGAQGTLAAHTDFGEIEVRNGEQVTLDLSTNSGSVSFSGTLGDGPHKLATDFGSIEITFPQDSRLTLDLKTGFGKVRSELPITMDGSLTDNRWNGKLNGGGALLTAETNSGSISLLPLEP